MSRIPNVQAARTASAALSAVLSLIERLIEQGVIPVENGIAIVEQASRDAGDPSMIGMETLRQFLDAEITRLRERYPGAS